MSSHANLSAKRAAYANTPVDDLHNFLTYAAAETSGQMLKKFVSEGWEYQQHNRIFDTLRNHPQLWDDEDALDAIVLSCMGRPVPPAMFQRLVDKGFKING